MGTLTHRATDPLTNWVISEPARHSASIKQKEFLHLKIFLQESSLNNLMITCQAVAKTIFDKYFTVHVGVRVLCTSATFCNLLTQELDLYVALYSQYIYIWTISF